MLQIEEFTWWVFGQETKFFWLWSSISIFWFLIFQFDYLKSLYCFKSIFFLKLLFAFFMCKINYKKIFKSMWTYLIYWIWLCSFLILHFCSTDVSFFIYLFFFFNLSSLDFFFCYDTSPNTLILIFQWHLMQFITMWRLIVKT